jgi:hypothetical protein
MPSMIAASIRLTGILNDGAKVYRSYYPVADFGEQAAASLRSFRCRSARRCRTTTTWL